MQQNKKKLRFYLFLFEKQKNNTLRVVHGSTPFERVVVSVDFHNGKKYP